MDQTGKVAVVTGASSGIGEAVARRLAGEGMTVVAVARRADRLNALAAAVDRVEAFPADVASDEQVDEVAAAVETRHGACHVLVNNAGIATGRHLRSPADRAEMAAVMDVNFHGAVRTMTAFRGLLERSAPSQVVNVASVAGKIGAPTPAYSASKFALVGLVESAAPEWERHGIVLTQLNPGFIRTEGFSHDRLMRSPLTRWMVSQPEAVAAAVVDAVRHRRHERTVPRWYRAAVVLRHLAAPVTRAALRRVG